MFAPLRPDGDGVIQGGYISCINAGHGHLGWTMSCGPGRLVADLVAGRPPGVSLAGFPTISGAARGRE